jgi:hypothetical protein
VQSPLSSGECDDSVDQLARVVGIHQRGELDAVELTVAVCDVTSVFRS